jgi:hypothetical protein
VNDYQIYECGPISKKARYHLEAERNMEVIEIGEYKHVLT